MKILEATDFYFPWIAGPAPFIRNLSEGLVQRGHEVTILCPSPWGRPYEEPGPPKLRRVRTAPLPFGYKVRVGAPVRVAWSLVRSWRPDIVHVHHPFPISGATLAAAKLNGVPVVATNHTIPECTLYGMRQSPLFGPAKWALGGEIRAILGAADRVTTPTATAAQMLAALGFEKEIVSISNGVDTERFRPAAATPLDGPPVILYTGRLDDDKDMDTLMRALPSVLNQTSAVVRIGGEGTDRVRLERLVRELGISDRVRFTGYVPDDELPEVYRQATVYCISSRVELQSISTLEAMASGLPVVAVNAGALPELVHPDVNGCLVPPGDPQAFGQALVRVLENPALGMKFGRESRRVAEGHSIGAMISQYERLMRDVAMKRPARTVFGASG